MAWLRVRLGDRSYPIIISRGALSRAGQLIRKERISHRNVLVVSQKEIISRYESALRRAFEKEGFGVSLFLTPASANSEAAKSQAVWWKLIQKMASCDGKNKSLFLVAFGGGVIGDLTGFAASVYRRGVPYVQIPTTLTAQVDSAIGGKTAIDLPQGKNLLGCVYQPSLVISDPDLLTSLPDRHWSDGFAEVIKYGVIRDSWLFSFLERIGMDGLRSNGSLLEKIIFRCARIKAGVVEKDEHDKKGIRIVLNFGHTTGHAIEAASRFSSQYTHGEAIGIGMLVACDIAAEMGILKDAELTRRLEKTLVKFNLPLFYKGLTADSILKAMGYDKKNEAGQNRFILPARLARTAVVRGVPTAVILRALLKRKG
jgi:3-dehydroquinate synthase